MDTSGRARIGLTSLFPFTLFALPSNTARPEDSISPAVAVESSSCIWRLRAGSSCFLLSLALTACTARLVFVCCGFITGHGSLRRLIFGLKKTMFILGMTDSVVHYLFNATFSLEVNAACGGFSVVRA
jgi:hypothetical protein